MSRNGSVASLHKTTGLSCLYVCWTPRGRYYKLGIGDPAKRLSSHRTAAPDMELVAAVQTPNAEAIETRLLGHFADARIGTSENLEPTEAVTAWVQRFKGHVGVAADMEYVRESYATPQAWPWFNGNPYMDSDGQTSLEIVTQYKPLIGSGKGQTSAISEDWYTPPRYVEAVRELYGGRIDLDPASCVEANQVVQADTILTAEVDGLRHAWHGNVFLNPPWGRQGIAKTAFVRRAVKAYEQGEITAAVLVLNSNATTTAWFAPLFRYPICFPNHRVMHYGPGGAGGAPNSGTVFVYLGPDVARFADIFSQFGAVVPAAYSATRDASALAEDYDDTEVAA